LNYLKKIILTYRYLINFLPVLVLFPFLFTACSDDPSSLGSELLNQDNIVISHLDSFTDTLNQQFASRKTNLALGSSNIIIVGKDANVESQLLLAFSLSIADKYLSNYDSITFVSANLVFTKKYSFGDTLQPFNVGVHQVTSTWNSLFTVDSLSKLSYASNSVLLSANSSGTDLALDPALVKNWFLAAKDTMLAKNYGVLIKPTGACKFTGYASSNSYNENVPELKIVVKKTTSYQSFQDTLTYFGSVDVHIVTGKFPEPSPQTLTIQSGTGVRGKLWFDLSKLPADAIINKAVLTLSIDTLNMKVGTSYSDGLAAYEIADSIKDSTNSFAAVSLPRSGNKYSGDVQRIINNAVITKNNFGIMITSPYLATGLENFALFNSSVANNELKPRLAITYSQKKK